MWVQQVLSQFFDLCGGEKTEEEQRIISGYPGNVWWKIPHYISSYIAQAKN